MKSRLQSSPAASALVLAACISLVVGLFAIGQASASAPESGGVQKTKKNRYVGAKKCKTCHSDAETGDQHGVWSERGHSHAFEVLASDAAKKIASEKKLGDPQKEAECLKCHVTGHGLAADQFQRGFDVELGVQCESCHGPGEQHLLARLKAARSKVEGYPKISLEEIVSMPTIDTCTACHNSESPTFQPFCAHERLTEIKHWNPKKPRTDEEKKGYPCTCEDTCVCKKDSPDHVCRDAEKAKDGKKKGDDDKEKAKDGGK